MAEATSQGELFQRLGLSGKSASAGRPDEQIDWEAPTSLLLQTSLAKVIELQQYAPAFRILEKRILRALGAPPYAVQVPASEEEEAELRRSAVALAEVLQVVHPAIMQLGPLAKSENYLEGVASAITKKVNTSKDDYTRAAFAAWGGTIWRGQREPWEVPGLLNKADRNAAEIPDFITQQYLSINGVFQLIVPLAGLRQSTLDLRQMADPPRATPRRTADRMAGLLDPPEDRLHIRLTRRLTDIKRDYNAGLQRAAIDLRELMFDIQVAVATANTLAAWEQYIHFVDLLDDSIVDWLHDPKLGKAKAHRDQLDAALTQLEKYESQSLSPAERREAVVKAIQAASGLMSSPQFKETHAEILARLETIETVKIAVAGLAIAAAALITAGAAGVLAGAVVAGAFEGITVGGLAVGGALSWLGSLAIETLVFQYVTDSGTEFVYGPQEEREEASGDFLLNFTMGAVMRLSGAGYAKLFKGLAGETKGVRTVLATVAFESGRIGNAMLTMHAFTEAHMLVSQGRPLTDEERYRAVLTNVITTGALETAGFIMKPMTDRIADVAEHVKQFSQERFQGLRQDQLALVPLHDKVRSNRATREELVEFVKGLERLWEKEVKLIDDAYAGDSSIQQRTKAHRDKIDEIQLSLAVMGVEVTLNAQPPSFRRLGPGIVGFDPAARPAVDQFFDKRGATKKASTEILDAVEVQLKTGERIWMVEGAGPAKVPPPARVAAAELEAGNATVPGDASDLANQGLAKLKKIFNYDKSTRPTEEIVASIDPANLEPVLTFLSDPAFVGNLGGGFFRGLGEHMDAVDFGRAYGAGTLARIFRTYSVGKEWTPSVEAAIKKARGRIMQETTEAGRQKVISDLQAADTDQKMRLVLGDAKPKAAREPKITVSDKELKIETASEEFVSKYLPEARRDALDHNQTLTDAELEARASLAVIRRAATGRKFGKYSWAKRIAILDRFDQLARLSKLPNGPMVSKRGNLSEWLFNPHMGRVKKTVFVDGLPWTKGPTPLGASIPDFFIKHVDHVEWLNQKSDVRVVGSKAQAEAMARGYLQAAIDTEWKNIPHQKGDTYSIHFVRTPSQENHDAIVAILLGPGSPVKRVIFGPLPDTPVVVLPDKTVITLPDDLVAPPVPDLVPVP